MNEFLIYLLKSTALLSVFLVFYWLLLKKETSFNSNRKFLLAGLITSAVLPTVYFTRTVIIEANQPQFNIVEGNFPISEIPVQEPIFTTGEIITGIYLLGVAFMLIRLLLQLISLIRILSGGSKSSRDGIKIIKTKAKIAPFSFLNFIVYNPNLHSKEDLEHILKHEKAHVSQWHTIDVLLANLNLAYQWFNPFAWLYNKNLQQNLEFIADKEAVKVSSCKKEYQKTLVKLSVENFSPALTNSFYQSFIKKRIVMLNNPNSRKNSWKAILILPALLGFLLIFNTRTVAQVQQTREASSTSTMAVTISISKNTTNEQLESYKKVMAKQNLMLDFDNLKRSNDGTLTAITIDFLNTVNNNSGTFTKNDPNGIKTFKIKMTGDGKAAFADADETQSQKHEVLQKMGSDPLYIVNKQQYTSAELDGKTIEYITGYAFLDPENAVKAYGSKAKDGALIFSEGRIIDDLTAELKIIDSKKEAVNRKFVEIAQGSKPNFMELQSKFEDNSAEAGTRTTSHNTPVKNEIPGNPVYIVNGRVVKNSDSIKEIDPQNINEIHVLKGAAATSLYGKKAEDGAILITTKPVDTLKTGSFNFKTGTLRLQDTVSGKTHTYYASNVNITPKPGVTISSTSKDSIKGRAIQINYNGDRPYTISTDGVKINASQNVSGTGTKVFYPSVNDQKMPLYVVDGKEADKDAMDEIEPTNIESINVLKGESATNKYGKKGENGVIEITTKNKYRKKSESNNIMATVTSSTTAEGLNIIKNQLLEQAGVKVNFESVKRNKNGMITSIKIGAEHKNSSASATFEVTDGIPDVYVGLLNDSIIVSSTPPGK